MGGHYGTRIDHRVAKRLGVIALTRIDPDRIQTKGGILGLDTLKLAEHPPRIDRQIAVRIYLRLAHDGAVQRDTVTGWAQIQIVLDMHRLNQESQLLGEFLAHAFYAVHQFTALISVNQGNQPIPHLEADDVYRLHIVPGQLALFRRDLRDSCRELRS